MCYVCTAYLVWKFIKLGLSHPVIFKEKRVKVYHLEDLDLSEQLSSLIINTNTDVDSIQKQVDDEVHEFSTDIKVLSVKIWKLPDYIVKLPSNCVKLYYFIKKYISTLSIRFIDYLTMKAIDLRIKSNSIKSKPVEIKPIEVKSIKTKPRKFKK
jgi:hypothetical protein